MPCFFLLDCQFVYHSIVRSQLSYYSVHANVFVFVTAVIGVIIHSSLLAVGSSAVASVTVCGNTVAGHVSDAAQLVRMYSPVQCRATDASVCLVR